MCYNYTHAKWVTLGAYKTTSPLAEGRANDPIVPMVSLPVVLHALLSQSSVCPFTVIMSSMGVQA